MWGMVRGGLGVGVQDSMIGDAEPLVRRVLPDLEPLILSVWPVTHRELTTSACAWSMSCWLLSLPALERVKSSCWPDHRGAHSDPLLDSHPIA
jgi:hypothetical protein